MFHAILRSKMSAIGILRSKMSTFSTLNVSHFGRAGERDFIEPVAAVDDDGPLRAEHEQRPSEQHAKLRPPDTQKLPRCARGVDQRANNIKDRRHTELLSNGANVPHGVVQQRGEAEADAQLVEAAFDDFDAGLDVDAQGGQGIGRAAAATGCAIAVLGHRATRPPR